MRSEELAGGAILFEGFANELLRSDRYTLTYINSAVEFLGCLKKHNYHVDCLVFEVDGDRRYLLNKLQERSLFLPAVIFGPGPGEDGIPEAPPPKGERASPSVAGFLFTGGTLTTKCAIIV